MGFRAVGCGVKGLGFRLGGLALRIWGLGFRALGVLAPRVKTQMEDEMETGTLRCPGVAPRF